MIADTLIVIYLMAYICTIIYLVVLGVCMLWHRDNPLATHGEQVAKQRLTRTMALALFVTAFESLVFLPPMLLGYPGEHNIYKVLFHVVLMLSLPMVYDMMMAVVQRKVNMLRWNLALGLPFLVLAAWQIIAPPQPTR